jgi:hypothetical protein
MSVSISQYVGGIVTAIFKPSRLYDGDDNIPSGPAAIEQAMDELNGLQDQEFSAILGQPDIVEDDEADFFGDPKVVVPVHDVPYEGVNRLVFDLPSGPEDARADLNHLLDALGVDDIAALEGEAVPLGFVGGNEAVLWDELLGSDSDGEMQASEESIEDAPIVTEDSEADEAADESSVTVEETTVSPDGDEASSDEGTDEDDGSM